ncbi:MAG TPA: response regulator transcription factor [Bryobacteraceae bacterium]|nr:response regulator transcription factor [Bryobacteraceae bacterium]
MSPIRIALVDDHALLREVLARTLAQEPGFVIAGECPGVPEALELVSRQAVDIVLLDINLGSEQGGSFLSRARVAGYRGKILVVTAGVSEREAAWLLKRGCSGIFLKSEAPSELIERIRGVMDGTSRMDAVSVKAVLSQLESGEHIKKQLTPRECQVLRAVCEGLSNKAIADRLEVSDNTVKSFLQQLFLKIGVRTRAQLVAAAIEQYWDQLDRN